MVICENKSKKKDQKVQFIFSCPCDRFLQVNWLMYNQLHIENDLDNHTVGLLEIALFLVINCLVQSISMQCPGNRYFHLVCLNLARIPKEDPW